MSHLRKLILGCAAAASCLGVQACAARHQVQKLPNGDGTFILLVDYVTTPFRTHDVIVSLQEKQGIASEVAVFRDIQTFKATWLGPEDITSVRSAGCRTTRLSSPSTRTTETTVSISSTIARSPEVDRVTGRE